MIRRLICTAALFAGTLGIATMAPSHAKAQSKYYVPVTPIPTPAAPLVVVGSSYLPGPSAWMRFAPGHFHSACYYEVLIRHGCHWDVYATFREARDAERLARRLQFRGHDVHVRRVYY